MLIARTTERIIYESELVLRATQAPEDLTRIAADLRDLAGIAAGQENVAISIHVYGIHVRKIETAAANINELPLVPDIVMVPGSPLQNEIPARCELLHDLFRH